MTIGSGQESPTFRHLHTAAVLHRIPDPPYALLPTLGNLAAELSDAASTAAPTNSFDLGVLAAIERITRDSTFGALQHRKSLVPLAAAGALLLAAPSAFAQPRNPLDYESLGDLSATQGVWNFDTNTGQLTEQSWPFPVTNGEIRDGAAVFCFDHVTVASGATYLVRGARPLVLLSRSSMAIRGALIADGAPGLELGNIASGSSVIGYGSGGPGIGGASAFYNTASQVVIPGGRGSGPGGGAGGTDTRPAGGGSFGGYGDNPVGAPFITFANLLRRLEGGSGGGGAMDSSRRGTSGGGGGGAVELGAFGTIEITGQVSARGGDAGAMAGAGSGGGILIHAPAVHLWGAGAVDASGGASPFGSDGGGGRITVQSIHLIGEQGLNTTAVIQVARPNFTLAPVRSEVFIDFGLVPVGATKTIAIAITGTGAPDTVVNGHFLPLPPASPFTTIGSGIFSNVTPDRPGVVFFSFTPTSTQSLTQEIFINTDTHGSVRYIFTGTGDDGCGSSDFNGDGDFGTDADIEAFFRVLAGGNC